MHNQNIEEFDLSLLILISLKEGLGKDLLKR